MRVETKNHFLGRVKLLFTQHLDAVEYAQRIVTRSTLYAGRCKTTAWTYPRKLAVSIHSRDWRTASHGRPSAVFSEPSSSDGTYATTSASATSP